MYKSIRKFFISILVRIYSIIVLPFLIVGFPLVMIIVYFNNDSVGGFKEELKGVYCMAFKGIVYGDMFR